MPARHSDAKQTYTRYRETDRHDRADATGERQSPPARPADSQRVTSELLQEVLGETLSRGQENCEQLVAVLREFRSSRGRQPMDQELCIEVARQVLKHRLARQYAKLPADLFEEVGQALWNNDLSRQRIERLWCSLGDQT